MPATKQGTYRLETVLESGYAHFNVPLTQGNVWSILSGLSNKEKTTLESDKTKAEAYILESINNKRKNLGRSALTKDADLTAIALEKANNMALHDYVGHWTPE